MNREDVLEEGSKELSVNRIVEFQLVENGDKDHVSNKTVGTQGT